jgi:hypothetical protein
MCVKDKVVQGCRLCLQRFWLNYDFVLVTYQALLKWSQVSASHSNANWSRLVLRPPCCSAAVLIMIMWPLTCVKVESLSKHAATVARHTKYRTKTACLWSCQVDAVTCTQQWLITSGVLNQAEQWNTEALVTWQALYRKHPGHVLFTRQAK